MLTIFQRFPIIILLVTTSNAFKVIAEESPCDQTKNITFISYDIFDLTDPDTIFIHSWANLLHNKTKERTLINESAFFVDKCQINEEDLHELERHLRSKKYLRNASVKFDISEKANTNSNTKNTNNKVIVETWDNWSLLPTLDFSRKGGKNKFALGIKDRNLLGLGIDAEIEYFSNDQRTGYKFDTQFPLFLQNNINASIKLTRNDDGTSEAIFLTKEFVSFDTRNAFNIGFDNFNQIDTQYENGTESKRYIHKKYFTTASWQWLNQDSAKDTLRFGIGYTTEEHEFSQFNNPTFVSALNTSTLPTNRTFNYPFITIDYLQKAYKKLTNVYLINHIEDFNLGWRAKAKLGSDFSNNLGSPTLIWQSSLSKGITLNDNAFWFFDANFSGEIYQHKDQKDRLILSVNTEYFHKFNERWAGYFKNSSQFSQNQFLDSPLVLGGESGVRGYPLQYQHGKHSTQFSFEARYYPHINIYKLLELGGAAFIDSGRVFSQAEPLQNQSTWMTSVGLGARLYSTHSSEARVIHLDIIKPVTSDPNVNSIEFRVTTKQSF